MGIVTNAKQTSQEIQDLIAAFIKQNGVTRADTAKAQGSRSEGSRHKGKSTYMRGNRRAA
jgi:hypothetical protein